MQRWHKLVIALLLVAIPAIGTARAADSARWEHYGRPNDGSGPRLVVKAKCLSGEDSATHLRLIDYGDGRAVYGCSRKGY